MDTVHAPTDTTSGPRHKDAGDLEPGDWIWHHDSFRRVTHSQVHPQGGMVLLVFHDNTTTVDGVTTQRRLATDNDRAVAEADTARRAYATALRDLADLIVEHRLPTPRFAVRVGMVLASRDDLQAWADALGAPIQSGGTDGNIPRVDHDRTLPTGRVLAINAQSPPEPLAPVSTPGRNYCGVPGCAGDHDNDAPTCTPAAPGNLTAP